MNKQILEVWKFLAVNNVKYLTIGGLAVNIYGYGRNTGDIDIYIEDTLENRSNLKNTLKNLGLSEIESIETFQFVAGWTDFSLNFGLKLDVMTSLKGLEDKSFEELLNNAMIAEIDGIEVYFIDYDNLIISKKAANRPKDLLDIEELEKVNNSN
jgi:predicted nucleotidyltransferase